ncbi:hypothetical protein A176_002685 [Myxococcus hansupus]|uniref:ClpX-type ZB domain-containing protein n=1 Tax=Pseudomyxococcus hansupus TaxID=1297742 RepID=A0A0H4WVX0_9BACT|nr:ClpX C4-type zinc finger protein [Myxococcus hansupus]AKQ65773.1 hypothetical protein A176_002685 [Myxococcus hansupus]
MAENPRELIRAAQSAETQGDMARAVECLQKAAELYRDAGNVQRALQLLRHASRLDERRTDIAEEVNRLEWLPGALLARPQPDDDEDAVLASSLEQTVEGGLIPEVVHRQRLLEDALREAVLHASEEAPRDAAQSWVIDSEVTEDLPRLDAQLAHVGGEDSAASTEAAPREQVATARDGERSEPLDVPNTSAVAGAEAASHTQEEDPRAARVSGGAETQEGFAEQGAAPESALEGASDADLTSAPPVRRRREARLIERGPTRADAALDAWCSFCCRPRTDTGDLIAGPAGAFICKSCLLESQSLLGDVTPVPPPPVARSDRAVEPVVGLVGQQAAQALLAQSLQGHAGCLLVVGPEGCGKSIWFQQLQREGQGLITLVADLDVASTSRPVLVEDVDRLNEASLALLCAFLKRPRHHRPTVILSARGRVTEPRDWMLRGDARSLPLWTTVSLRQAVRDAVPTSVLEHVQALLPVHAPTQADYIEIARQRLSLREPTVSLSEDVLRALAAAAARSPRAGHELHALLNRVPAGTWGLEPAAPPSASRKARRKPTR